MGSLLNNMMLSCKKATELIEKKSVVELLFTEKMQLKMHTLMCSTCKKYESQSKIIDLFLNKINSTQPDKQTLSQSVKTKVLAEIEKK